MILVLSTLVTHGVKAKKEPHCDESKDQETWGESTQQRGMWQKSIPRGFGIIEDRGEWLRFQALNEGLNTRRT